MPDIDTYVGLMHTLFALEDMYGLKIKDIDGELCLCLDKSNTSFASLFDMCSSWQQQAEKLEKGEISKDEYDEWRYRYPALDTYSKWTRIPSQELSDPVSYTHLHPHLNPYLHIHTGSFTGHLIGKIQQLRCGILIIFCYCLFKSKIRFL